MDLVSRATIVYFFLLIVIRAAGKRELGQLSPFDFVILLIISEALQPALTDDDRSIIGSMILVSTLAFWHIVLAVITYKSPTLADIVNGVPTVLVRNGRPDKQAMDAERVPESDIIAQARAVGLESMDQIKQAVLESDGKISIIPREGTSVLPRDEKTAGA